MSRHTPGKWVYEKSVGMFEIAPVGEDGLPDWSREVACTVSCDGAEEEANARLIAAAPAMYEALKELADIMQGVIDSGVARGLVDSFTLQPARAILSQIDGEQ